jgi:hypothetical protein
VRLRLLELLGHLGRTPLLAAVHQLPVTLSNRPGDRTGGRECTVGSLTPEIGGIRGLRKRRELHPFSVLVQPRAGRQGQGARAPGRGRPVAVVRAGRTPCVPCCLPDGVPVTLCHRQSAGMVPLERIHPSAGPSLRRGCLSARTSVGVGAPMRAGASEARTSARTNESENAAPDKDDDDQRTTAITQPHHKPVTRAGNARHSVTTPVTTI